MELSVFGYMFQKDLLHAVQFKIGPLYQNGNAVILKPEFAGAVSQRLLDSPVNT